MTGRQQDTTLARSPAASEVYKRQIRFIEQENGQLHFKAGGGITAKSRWESEYNEVIQKIYVPIY